MKSERERAYAYARKHLLMFDSEVNRTREHLAYFANAAGYELAATFIEEIEAWPAAFERLIQAVIRDRVEVVILPSMLHFAVLGDPTNIKQHFEAATGARIIAISNAVSHTLGDTVS
jgi:hypothetical protein